jgi:hypothetical protein
MKRGEVIEIGVGRVVAGKEAWMYGEYFPAAGPVMAEWGLRTVASFRVVATNRPGIAPVQGSLSAWPSAQRRHGLDADPRFLALRPARDAALEVLDDSHLFQAQTLELELSTDQDYALVLAKDVDLDALIELPFDDGSLTKRHAGRSLAVLPWGEATELLLAQPADNAEVYRVRFNP